MNPKITNYQRKHIFEDDYESEYKYKEFFDSAYNIIDITNEAMNESISWIENDIIYRALCVYSGTEYMKSIIKKNLEYFRRVKGLIIGNLDVFLFETRDLNPRYMPFKEEIYNDFDNILKICDYMTNVINIRLSGKEVNYVCN